MHKAVCPQSRHAGPAEHVRDTHECTCGHTGAHSCLCPQSRHAQARLSVHDRALKVAAVLESLERDMQLLCVTGVEDRLQEHVRPTLETLRNAGIKVPPGLPRTFWEVGRLRSSHAQ